MKSIVCWNCKSVHEVQGYVYKISCLCGHITSIEEESSKYEEIKRVKEALAKQIKDLTRYRHGYNILKDLAIWVAVGGDPILRDLHPRLVRQTFNAVHKKIIELAIDEFPDYEYMKQFQEECAQG